jgi:hypothetical protein
MDFMSGGGCRREWFSWVLGLIIICITVVGCHSSKSGYSNQLLKEGDPIGSLPTDWLVAETNGKGSPAMWQVVADKTSVDGSKAVAITQNQNTGQTFNMLIHQTLSVGDAPFSVKLRALSGKEDQGGGPVWRYQDNNNYYIARWNPLEKNFRVYVVREGKRKQLASVDVTADPAAWHTIAIDHAGNRIKASLDGRQLIEVTDDTFSTLGKIGLWTKADAATAFDALQIFYPIE